MKLRISAIFAMICFMAAGVAAQMLPQFSTEAAPAWYYVQFQKDSHTLADKGNGQVLRTANKSAVDAQKWQLIGTEKSFIMKSKAGNYVTYNGSRYASTSSASSATALTLSQGSSNCWSISRTTDTGTGMNQWGGTSVNAEIGDYDVLDVNNALNFVLAETLLPALATSADDDTPWVYLAFKAGASTTVISAPTVGQPAKQAGPDGSDGQLWKLVGSKDNFQLVNKAGHYVTFSAATWGTQNLQALTPSATPYSSGFSLIETSNSANAPAWEIRANGVSGTKNILNAWGGIEAGNYIGLWEVNDKNNAFEFINEKSMRFGDFKVIGSTTWRPESRHTLWYTTPATLTGAGNIWMEYSLPLGNGQLGASMFNGVSRDQLLINDKTLWSGSPTSYGYFLNFGSIYVDMLDEAGFGQTEEDAAINYYRALDLTTATGVSGFSTADGSVNYKREYIVSNPDGVVAMHISADQPGKIFQTYTLDSKPGLSAATTYADGEAFYYGSLETLKYSCRMKVIPTGGTMTTDANGGITVKGADEVLVILRATTDFDNHKSTYTSGVTLTELHNAVKEAVDAAAAKGWETLLADHVADHQKYYSRVNFNIGGAENNIPTNELVDEYNKTTATDAHKMLEELYFSYGRYLEIASSRGADLPSNLQGIWNNIAQAPWHSDIHANINVQMNYWPAESTNLTEMHVPFLNYITTMAESNEWKKNARNAGQTIGWTCYTENNIFGGGSTYAMNYVIANAWYCSHLWQHYCYTLDKEYLAKAFPAMWSCTLFWTERMILEAATDTYVCTNEFSPEQNGINENGVPHAQQIMAYLFDTTLEALEILGDEADVEAADVARVRERHAKLDRGLHTETYTGVWGTGNGVVSGDPLIREWRSYPYSRGENGHRHMSHLMAVYPFNQITADSEYYTAAVNSMKLRGDASTGWSMGWKANLWARLLNGERAYGILHTALRHSTSFGTDQSKGGIYYNLFDSHSPFQIDGNFGSCAGIAEMIMQSQNREIHLFPAIPTAWKNFTMTGLKGMGDFTVDLKWADGQPAEATIVSNQGQPLVIRNTDLASARIYLNGEPQAAPTAETYELATQPGDQVFVAFGDTPAPSYSNLDEIAAAELDFTVIGRTITAVCSTNVSSIKVYDLQGRQVAASATSSVTVPASAGHMVLVTVTTAGGTTVSHKVAVK